MLISHEKKLERLEWHKYIHRPDVRYVFKKLLIKVMISLARQTIVNLKANQNVNQMDLYDGLAGAIVQNNSHTNTPN